MQSVIIDQQLRISLPNEMPGTFVGFDFKSVKRARCVPCLHLSGYRQLIITDCCKAPHFQVVADSLTFKPGDYYFEVYRQTGPQRSPGDPLIYRTLIRIRPAPSSGTKAAIFCN